MPTVSVLVATCNRAALLVEALESLLAQRRPPDQVLVVDDGSTDATAEVLAGYRDRVETLHTANGGKSRALNLGLPRVRGDYLWIFDDDDLALPDALERHLALFAARPGLDLSYAGMYDQSAGATVEVDVPDLAPAEVFCQLFTGNFLQQQGMLVRTDCYRQVGPFAEHLLRSQDYEMALRLTRRFRAGRLPGPPTFIYRRHGGRRGLGSAQFEPGECELTWLAFDRLIVRQLVAEVELCEYLPGHRAGVELTALQRRQAHLWRFCVAVRRGLWDLGLADLAAAFEADAVTPLGEREEESWRLAFDASYGRRVSLEAFCDDPGLSDRIAHLCSGPAGLRPRENLAGILTGMAGWGEDNGWQPELVARLIADAGRLAARSGGPSDLGTSIKTSVGAELASAREGGRVGSDRRSEHAGRATVRPRALLLELCAYHWELFPPWHALFGELGWDLDVAADATPGHQETLALLDRNGERNDGHVQALAAERLEEIPFERYSLVVLGTLVHEGYRFDDSQAPRPPRPTLELLREIGLPSLAVIHEPSMWAGKGEEIGRHLATGRHAVVTFSRQGSAHLGSRGVPAGADSELPWLLPFVHHERRLVDRAADRVGAVDGGFVFPGSVDYDRKAIPSLLSAAATLPPGESVLVVGGSREADFDGDRWVRLLKRQIAEQGLAERIRFTGYLPFGEFLEQVGRARFLLPLVDERVDGGSYLTKMPAAVALSLGFGVPLIVDETIARHFGLERMVCYRDGDLAAGLDAARRLTGEEYARLCRLTAEAAERFQAHNRRTLDEILRRLVPHGPGDRR